MTSRGQCQAVWICKFPERLVGGLTFRRGAFFYVSRGKVAELVRAARLEGYSLVSLSLFSQRAALPQGRAPAPGHGADTSGRGARSVPPAVAGGCLSVSTTCGVIQITTQRIFKLYFTSVRLYSARARQVMSRCSEGCRSIR